MNNMIDKFNIGDSLGLKGLVILEDKKNNKIILKKENMILKEAKKFFLYSLLNGHMKINSGEGFSNADIPTSWGKLNKVFFSDIANEVSYTDTISSLSLNNNNSLCLPLSGTSTTDNLSIFSTTTYEKEGENFVIKITISIEVIDPSYRTRFNTLGLVMSSNPNAEDSEKRIFSNDTLFSRIKFDPIILNSESNLKLSYYVYF